MRVTVQIDDRKLKRELRKLQKKLDKFNEALQLIADEIEEAIDIAFAQKKTIDNKGWKPWSETTEKVWGTRGSLLNRTGRLKSSIKVVTKDGEIRIEVRNPAAAVHQYGNPSNKAWGRGRAPIPARPYLPIKNINNLHPDMVQIIEGVLAEYFEVEQ